MQRSCTGALRLLPALFRPALAHAADADRKLTFNVWRSRPPHPWSLADVIRCRIADTDMGMSQSFLTRIFDEFARRTPAHTRTQYKGSGPNTLIQTVARNLHR